MDMQGKPIGGTNSGTKVTTDPKSDEYIRESAGAVASDSLAADSYRSGGGFSQNRDAAPAGVSGSSATWNTTDTTNAKRLDSARDAPSRDPDTAQRYPEGSGGQTRTSEGNNNSGGSTDTYGSSSADKAPSYTLAQQGAYQDTKPKGRNLTEGGFSGEGSNYASGIGTRDDPGREALKDFQKRDAQADPGARSDIGGIDNEQPYGSLKRDERA